MTSTLLLVIAYFLPTVVAANRRHARQGAVLVLNALAGWTVVGWVAALFWSLAGDAQAPREGQPRARSALATLAVFLLVLGGMVGGAVLVYAGSVGEAVQIVGGWLGLVQTA